jgi:hypothetical protein
MNENIINQRNETVLLLLEAEVKAGNYPFNGYQVDTFECDTAAFFVTGVDICRAGGELPEGTNEKTQRGYQCQKNNPVIGSK